MGGISYETPGSGNQGARAILNNLHTKSIKKTVKHLVML